MLDASPAARDIARPQEERKARQSCVVEAAENIAKQPRLAAGYCEKVLLAAGVLGANTNIGLVIFCIGKDASVES